MVLHPGLFYWVGGALLAWRGDKLRLASRQKRLVPWAFVGCATVVAAAGWLLHVKIDPYQTNYFLSDWAPRIASLSDGCRKEMEAHWDIRTTDISHWWQRPEWEEVYRGVSPPCADELRALPLVPRIKLVVRP